MQEKVKKKYRKAARNYLKSLALWRREAPELVVPTVLHAVISGIAPYVGIYFLGRLMSALFSGAEASLIYGLLVLMLGLSLGFGLLQAYLHNKMEVGLRLQYLFFQRIVNDKLGRISMEDFDSGLPEAEKDQLVGLNQYSNMGLATALVTLPELLQALTGVVSALVLVSSLFTAPATKTGYEILNAPYFSIGLLLLLIVLPLMGFYFTAKSQAYWVKASDLATEGNRIFSYICYTSDGQRSALERRLYSQEKLFPRWLEKNTVFMTGGYMHQMAKGAMGRNTFMSALMPQLAILLASAYVVLKTLGGAFDLGHTTRYLAALAAFVGGLDKLVGTLSYNYLSAEVLEESFAYLERPEVLQTGTARFEGDVQSIRFENVSYTYPNAKKAALHQINVTLDAGKRYALVGPNGSGKTTFIKILTSFYKPSSGEVLINGEPLSQYRQDSVHEIFTAIFQDFGLLAQPLGENIAGALKGTPAYDEERIRQALKQAGFQLEGAHFKEGLETYLYKDYVDTGISPSGGEAQKIAIARALYKPAQILLMDEPTAALDPVAESEMYERLDEIVKKRVVLYVSHRLSSCQFCDEILVFEGGQIVQQGSHRALLADEEGLYHKLWHAQAKHYQED